MSGIHAARVKDHGRLFRVLRALKDAGPKGIEGWALEAHASIRAGGTCVSELRSNGHAIDCEYTRTTEAGGKVYTYTYRRGTEKPEPRVRRVPRR